MSFNSYIFILLFLPILLIGYYGLQYFKLHKCALIYMTGMSLWFYGYYSVSGLALLVLGILINYLLVQGMWRIEKKQIRKGLFFTALLWNLGMLLYFKYANFFIENISQIFETEMSGLSLVLPLGISFYTFQQIAYVVDSYRKDCENYSLLEYAAFVTFFPKVVQGPLASHEQIIHAFRDEKNGAVNYENLSKGLYAFVLGLAKKVLIADTLAPLAAKGYYNTDTLNATTMILSMLMYALQIYYDFSGYCDMALGIGYMLNIKLPINFNSPYKSTSIDEFWNRWHISLTQFFTKYVYFPLGGSRKGAIRTYINILTVFLLSGLWHGANWTFIIWGAMHGMAKVLERIGKKWIEKIPKAIRGVFTFVFVVIAWSLFRAESFRHATKVWRQAFTGGYDRIEPKVVELFNELLEVKILGRLGPKVMECLPELPLLVFVGGITIACFVMKNTQQKLDEFKGTNLKIVTIVLLLLWCLVSLTNANAFLYVNF